MSLIALLFTGLLMVIILGRITLIQTIINAAEITVGEFQIGILLIWSMFSFAAFALDG